jgi:predicted transcriptional regulator
MARISRIRRDLISFEKIYSLKENLKINYKDLASIIGISYGYLMRLKEEGVIPVVYYQALVNAIKHQLADEYFSKIKLIDDITNQA